MSKEQSQITEVLSRYLSPLNRNAILRQTFRDGKVPTNGLSASERAQLLVRMERSLALFLPEPERDVAVNELRVALHGKNQAAPSTVQFDIRLESDISLVRTEARRIAEALGANGFAVQKVVTIVSELARNMVFYAGGGDMTLSALSPPNRGLAIAAIDTGSGIPDVAHVMSGNYRSRTGLGRGLLGCKRLADKFYLDSDATGTRIEVEVKL